MSTEPRPQLGPCVNPDCDADGECAYRGDRGFVAPVESHGVTGTFVHPCQSCGRTVHVVDTVEQPHGCAPAETTGEGLARAWWAGHAQGQSDAAVESTPDGGAGGACRCEAHRGIGRATCEARSGHGLCCTLAHGHDGTHLACGSVTHGYEEWPQADRPVVSSPVQVDGETLTLAWMQRTQPWTQPYSRSFEDSKSGGVSVGGSAPLRSPEQHRPLMHDLMHVTKAVGVLASIAEWADHGSIRTERVDQAEFEGRIADLVMCALHMANNPPKGYETFDLQRAVIERVERVNSVKWASS